MPFIGERSPAIRPGPHTVWYHGSPLRLTVVRAGSTVSPILELAKAFAHKPPRLDLEVRDADGVRISTIVHNGVQDGYLYRVVVESPAADLQQHPGSGFAMGEEMLTTRDLALEYIQDLPVAGSHRQEVRCRLDHT